MGRIANFDPVAANSSGRDFFGGDFSLDTAGILGMMSSQFGNGHRDNSGAGSGSGSGNGAGAESGGESGNSGGGKPQYVANQFEGGVSSETIDPEKFPLSAGKDDTLEDAGAKQKIAGILRGQKAVIWILIALMVYVILTLIKK